MADPYNTREVLVELINLNDNLNVTVDDVEFGTPVRVTDPNPPRNTRLQITSKTESGFYGVKTINYNRMHISEIGTIQVERGAANNHIALLPAINTKYGLFLTAEDIVDQVIPVGQTGLITVPLEISANSLSFYGGAIIVTS
jgi:hypothetical protein